MPLKERQRASLATQIIWRVGGLSAIAIIGVVCAVAAVALVAMLNSYRALEDNAHDVAAELDRALTTIEGDMAAMGAALHTSTSQADLMRSFLDRHPKVFRVYLLDADGTVLLQQQRVGVSPSRFFDDQPWLTTDTVYWESPSAAAGFPFIRANAPVWSGPDAIGEAERVGTFKVEFDLTSFWDIIEATAEENNTIAYIIDSRGHLLTHSDVSFVFNAPTLNELTGKTYTERIDQSGNFVASFSRGTLGGPVLSATHIVSVVPWAVIAERSLWEVLGAFYLPGAFAVVLGGVAVWLIVGVVWFARQRITHPLVLLTNQVDRFRQGDFTGRIHLSAALGDEVDTLTRTFNDMADSIEQRTRALLVANARAEESSRLKTEFLATISHELRTPLNAIMGYCGILMEGLSGELDDNAMRMVSRIDLNSVRLLDLINDLLDLSRIETGNIETVLEPFDPRELVQSWDDIHRVLIEGQHLSFVVDVEPNMPAQLYGDPKRLTQIATNLLSNALKFTREGEIHLTVSYHITDWRITVTDTGIGIPQQSMRHIFEKFRQVDGSSTREYGGIGLGLTIVEQITRMMGGTVDVQSTVDEGSRFEVTLPVITKPEEARTLSSPVG